VLDNASAPDQRPTPADFPSHAKIIQSEANLGFAAANNRLAALAQTPYIALLNPDAFPAPSWLEELIACAQRHPRAAAIGSTQIMDVDPARYDGLGDCLFAFGGAWRGGRGRPIATTKLVEGECFSASAAAALYRSDAWREVGGFDESFFCYGEDVDLGFRLRLRNWISVQAPEALVRHVGGASASSAFSAFHSARNGVWLFAKSMPGFLYWALLPGHLLLLGMRCATSLLAPTGRHYRAGVGAAFAGLPRAWRARASLQPTRTASIVDIARVLTWSPLALIRRQLKITRLDADRRS
jgi:GT2 family glycosyltransferase